MEEGLFHKLRVSETKAATARTESAALQNQLQRERDSHEAELSALKLRVMQLEEAEDGTHVLAQELETARLRLVQLESDLRRSKSDMSAYGLQEERAIGAEGLVIKLKKELKMAKEQWNSMEASLLP